MKHLIFRIALFFGVLLAAPASASTVYWSLFNQEGETTAPAVYVTYGTLDDMLNDTNRLSTALPDGFGAARNVVGSGADGSTFWSLFNIEGESSQDSVYVTYGSLTDMLNDSNRLSTVLPDGFGASANVVGSGSDGSTYWSLFNAEGESSASSVYVTYGSLNDMLNDTNRLSTVLPDGFGASANVVGSGAFWVDDTPPPSPVPVPAGAPLMLSALGFLGWIRRRKAASQRPA